MSYNLREKFRFIGYSTNQIVATNNLPTIKQVLAVLLYNLRRVSTKLRDSAKLTIEECRIFWQKARIPVRQEIKCIIKLEAEYERLRKIQKNPSRKSDTQKIKEKEYEESIDRLFDIAHANALSMMEDEDDKTFLLRQREMRRSENPSSSISDAKSSEPSPMEVENEDSHVEQHESFENVNDKIVDSSVLLQPAPKELLDEIIGPESESPASQSTPPLKQRATEQVITAKLAVVLDKCKISKRNAVHLLIATAEALGVDTRALVINATCIHEARRKLRQERYEAIKKLAPDLFSDLPSIIHFDGKLLPEYLRRETTDRLAVIITCGEIQQLLGVPKITSGSGAHQAQAVFDILTEWSLLDNIEALCCDSTSSNTGKRNGACALFETLIDKELLWLICRRHIYELVLRCVFEVKFGKTTGPDVPLFREFEKCWSSIDKNKYEPGISDSFVNESLQDLRERILNFCTESLKKGLIRCDYKEFLELVLIFLGGKPPGDVIFHPPGAIHHARWMAKAIYNLKIYIFREQFLSNRKDVEEKCRDVCIFIVRVYTEAWFLTPFAAQAPMQDLNFLKCLNDYRRIDQSVSDSAVKKFRNHLWYLTPELTALAFFDANISDEDKSKMCEALKSNSSAYLYEKRILANDQNVTDLMNASIYDFICKDTCRFFERFRINTSFLTKDPSKWKKDRSYINGLEVVRNLKVVNDVAERGVKLMTEFNNLLTKDPNQIRYLLPVINDYRSLFPDSKKSTLTKPYV